MEKYSSNSFLNRKHIRKDSSFYEKLLIFGNSKVGKSELINNLKYIETQKESSIVHKKIINEDNEESSSLSSNLNILNSSNNTDVNNDMSLSESKIKIKFDDNLIKEIQIIEISYPKNELFSSLTYMCQCICILFDITDIDSFVNAKNIIVSLKKIENPNFSIILVSTKNDLENKNNFIKEEVINNFIQDINNKNKESFKEINSKEDDEEEKKSKEKDLPKKDMTIRYINISNKSKENINELKTLINKSYEEYIIIQQPYVISHNNTKNKYSIKSNSNKEKTKLQDLNINNNNQIKYIRSKVHKRIIKPAYNKGNEGYNVFKIILLGDTCVGKTAFFYRFFLNEFTNNFTSTIGINENSKYIKIYDSIYKIQLWDTAGQERFKSIPRKYYEKADGIILLYDITKEESFHNVYKWIKDIYQAASENLVLYLLGNKIDLINNRKISYESGKKIALEKNMKFMEISCKWDLNVTDATYSIIYDMYKLSKQDESQEEQNSSFNISVSKLGKQSNCC